MLLLRLSREWLGGDKKGMNFCDIDKDGIHLHLHVGQWKVWQSKSRFTFMISGTQSGKTCL